MVKIPGKILTWQMIQPASRNLETGEVIPGKLEKKEIPVPELNTGEVLVEIELILAGFFCCGRLNLNLGGVADSLFQRGILLQLLPYHRAKFKNGQLQHFKGLTQLRRQHHLKLLSLMKR